MRDRVLTGFSRLRRASVASVVATAVALALTGCVLDDGSGATSAEARRSLFDQIIRIQSVMGGSWTVLDDPTPRGCTIPLGIEGELYPVLRVGAAPDSPDAALARLIDYWAGEGLSPITTSVGAVTELQVRGHHAELVVVRVSDSGITIHGESECRPLSPESLAHAP